MLGQIIGAGVGGLVSGFNAYQQAQKQRELLRLEEDYNRSANAKLERANEANQLQNPYATAQRARQDVNSTLSAATGSALNAAAGQMASSGDFGNAQGAGIAMSQASQAAAAPYAQQLSGITQQAYQDNANKIRQSESIANSQAALSQNVNYIDREKQNINPLGNALQAGLAGVLGGANLANNLFASINDRDKGTGEGDIVQTQDFVGPMNRPQQAPVQQPVQQPAAAQPAIGINPFANPYNMGMTLINGVRPVLPFLMNRNQNF
jgi:hypothetical protein